MKKIIFRVIIIFSILAAVKSAPQAIAQIPVESPGESPVKPSNVKPAEKSGEKSDKEISPTVKPKYQVFDANNDWRSGQNVPFSTPVYVKDAFDGDYLAVFDKNFSGNTFFGGTESGVISNWSRKSIKIHAYRLFVVRSFFNSSSISNVLETKLLEIKLGDRIFRIQGENGDFPVSEELARALASAPEEVTKTRIMIKDSGQTFINDIGIDTVRSWRAVYGG